MTDIKTYCKALIIKTLLYIGKEIPYNNNNLINKNLAGTAFGGVGKSVLCNNSLDLKEM